MVASGDAAGVGGDPGPEVGALLGHGTGDGRALHLTLEKEQELVVTDVLGINQIQQNNCFKGLVAPLKQMPSCAKSETLCN